MQTLMNRISPRLNLGLSLLISQCYKINLLIIEMFKYLKAMLYFRRKPKLIMMKNPALKLTLAALKKMYKTSKNVHIVIIAVRIY